MNKDLLQQLEQHQNKFDALQLELKTMDLNHPDFEPKTKLALAEQGKINTIMSTINTVNEHNKQISGKLNDSEEHLISEFISPKLYNNAISFNL